METTENFAYLRYRVEQGWIKKKLPTTEEYLQRKDYELSVIEKMNFCDYFLIIEDIVNWAKDNGIPAGPGRGSGAGSIVCYALNITTIDPIKFGLFFERFLNSGRFKCEAQPVVSELSFEEFKEKIMPSFDIDLC